MPADVRPDYHFLLIAPNLGAEWLFDAARLYWDTFRPTVISDFDFLFFIPTGRTISVTMIARRDIAPQIGVELSQVRSDAYLDPVVFDLFEDTRAELNRRAETQQPFGVPITGPVGTLDPNAPIIPTPRLPPTRPPAGFVTETPVIPPATSDPGAVTATPAAPNQTLIPGTPTTTPPEEPTAESGTRAPVTPRGPVTGGG